MTTMTDEQLSTIRQQVSDVLEQHGLDDEQGTAVLFMFGAYLGAFVGYDKRALKSTANAAIDLALAKAKPLQPT